MFATRAAMSARLHLLVLGHSGVTGCVFARNQGMVDRTLILI
jgi:hypothetical protein